MSKRNGQSNVELISRYTDQPTSMPLEVREKIEKLWNNQPVQLYAISDLSPSMQLLNKWVALGKEHLSIVADGNFEKIDTIQLSKVKTVRETPGLSCTTLTFLGEPDEPPLAALRYTNRQKQAMETIKFIVEQRIAGNGVSFSKEPDKAYSDSVTQSIRDAQASVAANKMTVVWRLLSYLKPFSGRVILGMMSAVVMTVVSLLPAYLTGYVIDEVVKPFQNGLMDYQSAMSVAWVIIGTLIVT